MTTRTTSAIVIFAGVAVLFGLNLYSQDDLATEKRAWEHLAFEVGNEIRIKDPDFTEKIVQLGNDGWELVDVESRIQMGNTTKMIYFFKRPK